MKLRSKAPILRNWQGTGHMRTDTAGPSERPMLVIDGPNGGPVGPVEAYGFGYEITEATEEELDLLRKGGYGIPFISSP